MTSLRLCLASSVVVAGLASCLPVGIGSGGNVVDGRYVACGFTITPGGFQSYAAVLPSLDVDEQVQLADALPVGGMCGAGAGHLYGFQQESPEVVKYSVTDTGVFEELDRISFAGLGITGMRFPGQILSDEKAYIADSATLQVVVWNPTTMEILASLSLEDMAPQNGHDVTFQTAKRGDDFVVIGRYLDADGFTVPDFRVALVDSATDQLAVTTTDQCGGVAEPVIQSNGDIYFSSNTTTGAQFLASIDDAITPCVVRIRAGETEFDSDYFADLTEVTGERGAGTIIDGPGDVVYVLGYDDTLANVPDDAVVNDYFQAQAWRIHRISDIEAGSAASSEAVDAIPATSGTVPAYAFDDETYLGSLQFAFSGTKLTNVTNPDQPQEAMTAPGIVVNIFPLPSSAE